MYKCKYCNRICKNKNSLAQHEIRCKNNPDRINTDNSTKNLKEYNNRVRSGEITKSNSNQYVKAKNLGLPKPEISQETRQKLSAVWLGRHHSEESKQKTSQTMQQVVRERPESYSASNVGGRVKKVEYNGQIFDSTWEVIVAQFLDSENIEWYKPKNGFEYTYNNKQHIYYPDFYLPKLDVYIEVKGYKRPNDRYKWDAVKNLIVIKNDEILAIKTGTYKFPTHI